MPIFSTVSMWEVFKREGETKLSSSARNASVEKSRIKTEAEKLTPIPLYGEEASTRAAVRSCNPIHFTGAMWPSQLRCRPVSHKAVRKTNQLSTPLVSMRHFSV